MKEGHMAGPGAYWVGKEERREVLDVLDSGHLYRYGDLDDPKFKRKVLTFEKEFAEYCGAAYCQATSSGTGSILISLDAIGVKPGDEIIIPTYTFIASYSASIFLGTVPVLCEIDESLTMDPEDLERRITPKTKAIMPVHILGNPCNMDAIMEIARRHGIMVVEDCCQACGASYRGKKVGTFGEFGAFSLNINKTITAGDGGMVITDKKEYFEHAFAMQDQGHKPKGGGLSRIPPSIVGLSFRINELTGAVALAQLRKIDGILSTLHRKKKTLKGLIADIPGMHFRRLNDEEGECATLLTVIFDSAERAAKVSRALGTHTVDDSGWHVYSNMDQINRHLEELGRPHDLGAYPRTDELLKRSINISVGVVDAGLGAGWGIYIDSTDEEIERVGARFIRACEEAG
jgi:dTDP-4-amino-4,6-dideoxygalactose transaminase